MALCSTLACRCEHAPSIAHVKQQQTFWFDSPVEIGTLLAFKSFGSASACLAESHRDVHSKALLRVGRLLQVQEFFGDFVVLDSQHFCIPLPRPHVVLQPFSWDYANSTDAVTRMTEGLASLTLSLRRRFNIRCAHILACTLLQRQPLHQRSTTATSFTLQVHSVF